MNRLTRRRMLTALGLGAGSLAVPSWLVGGGRRAGRALADGHMPKRLVVVISDHGPFQPTWKMGRPMVPDDLLSDGELPLSGLSVDDFSETLRPFHPYRDRLLALEGLAQISTLSDEEGGGNEHQRSQAHVLTGANERPGTTQASGPSIGYRVGNALAKPGQYGVLSFGRSHNFYFPDADGNRPPMRDDPASSFDELFAGVRSDEPSEGERIAAERGSVLDLVGTEYEHFAGRLDGPAREKLERHRELLRDLELRVRGSGSACDPPGSLAAVETDKQFMQLAALALGCELTPAVQVRLAQPPPEIIGAPAGTDIHHVVAHASAGGCRANAESGGWVYDCPWEDGPGRQLTNYYRLHAEHVVYLLDRLAEIPEGDGSTLLDNTLVVWASEHGHGSHSRIDQGWVMVGDAQDHFRTGRYVKYGHNNPHPARLPGYYRDRRPGIGPAHSKLLVSIARAMGTDIDAMPVTGAPAEDGTTLDLTGPLDRLT